MFKNEQREDVNPGLVSVIIVLVFLVTLGLGVSVKNYQIGFEAGKASITQDETRIKIHRKHLTAFWLTVIRNKAYIVTPTEFSFHSDKVGEEWIDTILQICADDEITTPTEGS